MAFRDHLGRARTITEPTSCIHEIFSASKKYNHELLLFENIPEAPNHRLALNIMTRKRLAGVLGVAAADLVDLLGKALENSSQPLIVEAEHAPVMQAGQETVDLRELPIPWHYPEDRGRYMSASIVIAEYDGQRNVSFHRQFLRDENHVVARLVPRHLRTMVDAARAAGETIPIAIVNAPDPVVLLAAAMSFDQPVDELAIAAFLHQEVYGKPLEVVTLENGVIAPADSEYAMAGHITLEDDDEGPYVDITGTLDGGRQEPVFAITSVHHRLEPIFHGLIPAESEHRCLMGLPRAPSIKRAVGKVVNCVDVYLTDGGCGWLSAVVSIRPRTDDDGRAAITAALEGHRSMKQVIIVDDDIDISDPIRVEWAMMTRWKPDKDTVILTRQKGSSLDPSRDEDGLTSKVGFDATIPVGADRSDFTTVLR